MMACDCDSTRLELNVCDERVTGLRVHLSLGNIFQDESRITMSDDERMDMAPIPAAAKGSSDRGCILHTAPKMCVSNQRRCIFSSPENPAEILAVAIKGAGGT